MIRAGPLPLVLVAAAVSVAAPADASTALRPLAPDLAAAPVPEGGPGWSAGTIEIALGKLGAATPANRQRRRWSYALALLDAARPDQARGVLTVMAADEPDLRLVPAWRIVAARAAAETRAFADALALLDDPALTGLPEACTWRLLSLAALGGARPALAQLPCAKPALSARSPAQRAPFLWAAAGAALAGGRADAALHFLRFAPAGAPQARLLRAEALLLQDQGAAAQRLLAPLTALPEGAVSAAAGALRIEAAVRLGTIAPKAALAEAEALRFRWRGDRIERELAVLSWELALAAGKPRSALAAAATLLRHHPAEPRLPPMLGIVAVSFRRWLGSDSGVPLPLAAGLLWDHRDLLPGGAEGDALVRRLAARLAEEGLHARAADLLDHQLAFRARDLARAPLSIEIAQLRLLAGQPDRAQAVIRATADTLYPEPFAIARARMEAIALFQMGRRDEALALLRDLPATADLRVELLWRARDWEALARAPVGATTRLDPVSEVVLLRQVIAMRMIGDEAGLARLRARYGSRFAGRPTGGAFAALVGGSDGTSGGDSLAQALAALPAVSPAGADADLLDLSDAALKSRRARPSSRG